MSSETMNNSLLSISTAVLKVWNWEQQNTEIERKKGLPSLKKPSDLPQTVSYNRIIKVLTFQFYQKVIKKPDILCSTIKVALPRIKQK